MIQYQIFQTNITRFVWQTVMRITNTILGLEGLMIWLRLMIGKLSPAKAEGKQKLLFYPSTLVISVNRPLLIFSVSQFFSIAMLWYFMITEYKRICCQIWQRLEYVGLIKRKKKTLPTVLKSTQQSFLWSILSLGHYCLNIHVGSPCTANILICYHYSVT